MTPHYRQSFVAALTGHVVLLVTAVVVSVLPGCRRPRPLDILQFPDVDIKNIDTKTLSRPKPPPEHVIQPPPSVPTEVRDPVMPADTVPVRPRETPRPPAHDPQGTTPDHVRPPVRPAASNLSATGAAPVPGIKIGPRVVAVRPGGGPRRPLPQLQPGDLDPLNGMPAPHGDTYGVPMNEQQRCLLLIKRALYDAWDQPSQADAGQQSALLEISFDLSGRVVGTSLSQSSGSEIMDRSVLAAARAVKQVGGMSPSFLKEYPKVPLKFTVTE